MTELRYIRPEDFKEMLRPSGPLFVFSVPWMVAMCGQLAQLCGIIKPVYSSFYLVVIGNILSIFLLAAGLQIFSPQKLKLDRNVLDEIRLSKRFKRIVYGLISFYLAVQAFQVLYCGGFPLLWLIIKDSRNYFDYGIQSLNGFLNAVYLVTVTCFFIIYLKERSRKKLFLMWVLLSIPILTVTRQVLISAALQIACCYLIYNPKRAKKIFLWGCALMAMFIVVGNYRTGLGSLIEILEPKPYFPKFLYSFLWIYAYIVTPFNNINASFDLINSIGLPIHEMSQLIPTVLRPDMGGDFDTGFTLVHRNMTVSTFYLPPLLDFGRVYSFLMMAVFQFFLLKSYRKAIKTRSPVHLVEYSVLYMITILSIFSNLLFYLPVIFQLAILNLAKFRIKREKGHQILQLGRI